MPCLDPTLDVVFKLLLVRKPALLRDMLAGVLARPVVDLRILNSELLGQRADGRGVRFDIRAELDDGSRMDLEMQRQSLAALASRLVYYTARDYSDQLQRGDDYQQLTPTAGIAWVMEPLFPEIGRVHSIFELRERDTHVRLTDQFAIHLLQPSLLPPPGPDGYTTPVERWAHFFTTRDDHERRRLASGDPIMATALQTLEQLSLDPRARRLARDREDELKLYEIERRMELSAIRAEGEARGRASFLLKLLRQRFGPLSAATRTRIETATCEQLDAWAERVLSARTLDEILAP